MKSVFLVIGFVALLVYGGSMMERLDRYASGDNRRRRDAVRPRKALQRRLRAAVKRVAAVLPGPENAARSIRRQKPQTPCALGVTPGNLLRHK